MGRFKSDMEATAALLPHLCPSPTVVDMSNFNGAEFHEESMRFRRERGEGPIITRASRLYRDGWERTFGRKHR